MKKKLDKTKPPYSWFSHDVTKMQTKKLSLLLSFYFHVVFQHLLKNFIQTNFRFKRVLRFATLDAWISRRNAAFSWRPGKLLCGLKTLPILGDFAISTFLVFSCPWKGHKHGVSIQSFKDLGKTFFRISRIWNIAQTRFLARLFVYLSFVSFPRF